VQPSSLRLIVYVSQSTSPEAKQMSDVETIVALAKKKNREFGITGALFFLNGNYMQVIEGEEQAIAQLMQNIYADPRHISIEMVMDTPIRKRGFQQWNMDYFNLSSPTPVRREDLIEISEEFKRNLMPGGDIIVKFYKAILESAESEAKD